VDEPLNDVAEQADLKQMPRPNPDLMPKLDEQSVTDEFRRRVAASKSHSDDWRKEAKDLYDFQAGRQWDTDDIARMEEQNRPMVTFNLMAKFIDVVMGLQINNRQDIRCFPRTLGKAAVNETATGALAWCRDQCGADYEETDAGADCLLTGMGWIEDFYDDESDPDGLISQERRDPLEMFWDTTARKKNLVDRRWNVRLKRMTYEQYVEFFDEEPTGSVDVAGLDPGDLEMGMQVINKPQDYKGTGMQGEIRGHYLVADYQFWCLHKIWQVTAVFPGQGQGTQTFSDEEWPQIEAQLKAANIPYKPVMQKVRKYYRAWVTGGGIKKGIKDLPAFTFHAITGKRDRNKNLWFGLGRNLRDPQRWVNAFFSSIIWQLMVNAKGGVMMEEDAVEDMAEFEESWSDPSKVTWLRSGAIAAGKFQTKPSGEYPQGMDRLMQFSMDALPGVSGINAELLGLSQGDQPGIVEAQRKQGALAIIAWYFDALRRYYQEAGRTMLWMIRDFMADGRLIRIVGEEGAQYIPLMRDPLTAVFDIIVDEAPTSVNMQERVWAALKEMIPLAISAGVQIPPQVIQYSPLPDDLKQKWLASLQQPPSQQQQQAAAMAAGKAQADIRKTNAQADQASADAQLKTVEAQTGAIAAPTKIALDHVETIRKAAEAGVMQAGGHA